MTFPLWMGQRPSKPKGAAIQVDLAGLIAMMRDRAERLHDSSQYALVDFADDYRHLRNVRGIYGPALDFDDLDASQVEPLIRWASRWLGVAHTTKRHTDSAPRVRVVLLTDRPYTAEEHVPLWLALSDAAYRRGFVADGQAKGASKAWMWPCRTDSGPGRVWELPGRPVRVDAAIAYGRELMTEPEPESHDRPINHDPERTIDRARRYLATCDPAISGQGGQRALFWAALTMTRGFLLNPDDAAALLMSDYNPRCQPPWSEREVRRYCHNARNARGRMSLGQLLNERRAA